MEEYMVEKKQKNHFWKGALFGALAMFIAVIATVAAMYYSGVNLIISGNTANTSMQQKLTYLEQLINAYYLYSDDVTEEMLEEGIYTGYINALGDPYSVYYNEEDTKELYESTTGEYSGIGVVFSQNVETKISTAIQVYKNSPAEEAGVKEGDILYKVNGKDITAEDLNDVVAEIRGEEGTTVELTVMRGAKLEEVTMEVTRRKIEVETVTYEMKEDNVGYICITEFDKVTYDQFAAALEDLKEQGMEGLVIDLRSNPGGNLSTVVDMLDLMLPEGIVVYTEDKNGQREEYTSDAGQEYDGPLAVLVNGYSASASEIFAGAIQDYEAGTIVGTTSYGKGIVQQLLPLSDGTCVKLTVSEYFTPDGRNIHGVGIEPDIEIVYETDEENSETDNQLDGAIAEVKKQMAE